MSTMLGAMRAICAAAQAAAFPGVEPNVDCAVTDKGGADYQNNSALALFGRLKAAGLPSGGYSCRKAEDERDENAVGRGVT